jgi:uncharacterized membrane protein YbhN (UPF0104 family)
VNLEVKEHKRNKRAKSIAVLLARVLVVAAIYYLIFRKVDLSDMRPLLTTGFMVALLGAVVLNVLQAAICTKRWLLLARDAQHVPGFPPSFAAYMEGLFFNQALPSFVGGDAVRIMRWRRFGVGLHDAVVSVFRDRMFGAVGAAVFALAASVMLWDTPVQRYKLFASFALGAAALGAGAGVMLVIQSRRVTSLFQRFRKVHSHLQRISGAPLGPKTYVLSTAYALVGQLLCGLSVLWLARSVGIELSAALLVLISGIILVASMIPISLAGWGVREAGFLAILVPMGASHGSAMLLGVSFGLAGLLGAMLGGVSMFFGLSSPSNDRKRVLTNQPPVS